MDQKLTVLLIALLLTSPLYSQKKDTSRTFTDGILKNSVYAELGGNGLFGSINYERILALEEKFAFVPRVGLGYWGSPIALIELDFLYGGKHSLETGPGLSFMPGADAIVVTFRAGYRYMGKNGLLIRAAPMFWLGIAEGRYEPMMHLGLSVGYSF